MDKQLIKDLQLDPHECVSLLYSKRNRQSYTVKEMIHNKEGVNVRVGTVTVNKGRR